MADQSNLSQPPKVNQVLLAVRLGWLTVETFGRLRRYVRSDYQLPELRGNANERFDFSDRSLNDHDELFFAADQLHRTAARLKTDLPPCPLPAQAALVQLLAGGLDLNRCQGELDEWSRQVWTTLSTEDELTGRGFTYGGSLADTYWHTDVLGSDGLAQLLRPQRLEYLAARFDSIADYLPQDTALVLHHTLSKYRDEGRLDKLDADGKKHALERLESQAKVWHDLLFGSRSADSYLLASDRRWISLGALGITLALALVIIFGVWLTTLTMSSAGRAVTAGMANLPTEIGQTSLSEWLDWQKWSTLLATLSSVVVLLTGLVTNVSGWIIAIYRRLQDWLRLLFIYHRTYRS